MRRAAVLLLLLPLVLTGCWDSFPIERLGFVTLVAVDASKTGGTHLYAQVVNPSKLPQGGQGGASAGSQNFTIVDGEGTTTYEATKEADVSSPKRLYFGQLEDIFISERAAKQGKISEALDYFARGIKARNIPWVWVVPDRHFQTALSQGKQGASYPAAALDNLAQEVREESAVRAVRLFQVLNELQTPTETVSLPLLTVENGHFATHTMAILRAKGFVGTLDREASHGFSMAASNARRMGIVVPCPGGHLSLETSANRRQVKPLYVGGKLNGFHIKVKSTVRTLQNSGCNVNLTSPQDYKQLSQAAAANVAGKMLAAISGAQRLHADIFGFIRWSGMSPKQYQTMGDRWSHEIFPKLHFVVEVDAEIKTTGLLNMRRLHVGSDA